MKKYQISVFYDHILEAAQQSGKTIEQELELCKTAGITALEVNNWTLKDNSRHEDLIKKSGLKYNCIYEFYSWDSSTDFSKVKDHLDRAKRLNCSKVLIVPGFLSEKEALQFTDCSDYNKTAALMESNPKVLQIKEMLIKTVQYASELEITVTLEDFDDYKSPCAHANQLLWFFKNVPGLKWTFDLGNFEYSHENLFTAWSILNGYIANVHCKDRGPALASVPTGGGILPVKEMVQKICKETAVNNFSIEHFGAANQEEYIKKSALFLLNNIIY